MLNRFVVPVINAYSKRCSCARFSRPLRGWGSDVRFVYCEVDWTRSSYELVPLIEANISFCQV